MNVPSAWVAGLLVGCIIGFVVCYYGVVRYERNRLREYLVFAVRAWRRRRDDPDERGAAREMATHYIDAFQSVHVSIFGDEVPYTASPSGPDPMQGETRGG